MKQTIEQVIEEASQWLNLDGVEGIGQGEHGGEPCIVVLISGNKQNLAEKIPKSFKGYPVILEETGEVRAL